MAWRIEYGKEAEKEIAKLDRQIAQRIIKFMGNCVAKLVVQVVRIGNRREAYR